MFNSQQSIVQQMTPCGVLRAPRPAPQDERVLLAVSGMDCEISAAVVRNALLEVAGVSEVRCHAGSQSVWVRCHPQQVRAETLPLRMAERGFPARLVRLRELAESA